MILRNAFIIYISSWNAHKVDFFFSPLKKKIIETFRSITIFMKMSTIPQGKKLIKVSKRILSSFNNKLFIKGNSPYNFSCNSPCYPSNSQGKPLTNSVLAQAPQLI